VLILTGGAGSLADDSASVPARGTIAAIGTDLLTIAGSDGVERQVHLAHGTTILKAAKASLDDVTPGIRVSIANRGPNGLQDAIEIHILGAGAPDAGDGERRWDLRGPSRITTGRITAATPSYDGGDITLAYNASETTIRVGAGTPIFRLEHGIVSNLKPGAAIVARQSRTQGDGFLATSVIVGEAALDIAF
jgi:hypothetical protein